MDDLWECKVCDSLVRRDQIDGRCNTCGKLTCINCKRVCDGCTRTFCMNDIAVKTVMRQQKAFLHKLCEGCSTKWS